MQARIVEDLDSIPAHFRDMLAGAGEVSYFQSFPWYENLLVNSFPENTALRVYGVETNETPPRALCLFFAHAVDGRGPFGRYRALDELSNFYSLNAGPILVPDVTDIDAVVDTLVAAIASEPEAWPSIGFGPIDRNSAVFDALCENLTRHGLVIEPYFKHGNLYQDIAGQTFDQYMKSLRKNAREALRKSRKLDREHETRWTLTTDPADLPTGLAHYEEVYEKSWKEPEAFPDFMPRLMEHAASIGRLRLANLSVDGEVAATQLIILSGRHAVMFKTAYVPKFERYSIGAVVLVRLLKQIIQSDDVDRIDLGAGDEPYKTHWATQRQERWGIMAYNPRTVIGLSKAAAFQGRRLAKALYDPWRRTTTPPSRSSASSTFACSCSRSESCCACRQHDPSIFRHASSSARAASILHFALKPPNAAVRRRRSHPTRMQEGRIRAARRCRRPARSSGRIGVCCCNRSRSCPRAAVPASECSSQNLDRHGNDAA
jgi:hypothetical protein